MNHPKPKLKKKKTIKMADKTMPPTEAPTPQPEAMPEEMATPTNAPASGQVMVQMPADAFDSIHALVTQLASGLDALKADVDAQKGASSSQPAAMPVGAGGSPEMTGTDEEFLKSLAQEGSMR